MKLILYTLIFSILFSSCGGRDPVFETDIIKLKSKINLEVEPINVKYATSSLGIDGDITVILKLKKSDWLTIYNQHIALGEIYGAKFSKDLTKDWYPQSIKDCFHNSGNYIVPNQKIFPANFFKKSIYSHGFVFFSKNNEIFIHLST